MGDNKTEDDAQVDLLVSPFFYFDKSKLFCKLYGNFFDHMAVFIFYSGCAMVIRFRRIRRAVSHFTPYRIAAAGTVSRGNWSLDFTCYLT